MSSLTPERIAEIREEIQCSHELTGVLLMDERRLLDAFDRIAELESEVKKQQDLQRMSVEGQHHLAVRSQALEAEVAALREDKARLAESLEGARMHLETLQGCLPKRMYIYGAYGEMWSDWQPDPHQVEEYEIVDFESAISAIDAARKGGAA